ncbi:unnamed protein product [Cladocopium goreaui]|uniref:EF-hand domain-containing protein n=1 Tax=Cladocopium goreaui TaxID=2562237 RepID=A0A9P1BYB1_9DINO|nr:unnamed protein product [Cladocopium goreaui]
MGYMSFRDVGKLIFPITSKEHKAMCDATSDEEARSVLYILHFSEPCPQCGFRIQRDSDSAGCPSVVCSNCKAPFRCFVVGRPSLEGPGATAADRFTLCRLVAALASAAENLQLDRKRLANEAGFDQTCLREAFNYISSGRPTFDTVDLRQAFRDQQIPVLEKEMDLLWQRYSPNFGAGVTWEHFRNQLRYDPTWTLESCTATNRLLTAVIQTMVRQAATDAGAEDAKALGPKGCPLMALFESLDPTSKGFLLDNDFWHLVQDFNAHTSFGSLCTMVQEVQLRRRYESSLPGRFSVREFGVLIYPFDSKEYFALRPCTSDDDAKSQLYLLQKIKKQVAGLVSAGSKLQVSSSLRSAGLKDGAEVSAVLGGDDVTVKAHKFGWGFGAIINTSLAIWGHELYFKLSPEQRKRTEQDVLELFFTETAVAAIKADGEVVTCGDDGAGGDSHLVQSQLVDVISISGTSGAFAAVRADGSVVCWGNPDAGGDCKNVQDQLQKIRQVFSCQNAFAAVTDTGRVVTWGQPDEGGDSSAVQSQLVGVKHIVGSVHAFAAILRDGSVVSWGADYAGADSSLVKEKLTKVKAVYASKFAFAALKEDGTVVTWGPPEHGGDSSNVQSQLVGVHHIEATKSAFAAITVQAGVEASKNASEAAVKVTLKSRVVTWGDQLHGGDSSDVQHRLDDIVQLKATKHAFAGLRSDGEVVAWGSELYGGDASSVQNDLVNVKEIFSSQSSFAALRSDGGLTVWGHQDDLLYDDELVEAVGSHVQYVATSKLAMTAVKDDGTYVTWGSPDHGGSQ